MVTLDLVSQQLLLVLGFALGLLLCAKCLLQLLRPEWCRSRFVEVVASLMSVALAILLGFEALSSRAHGVVACLGGSAFVAAHLRIAWLRCRPFPQFSRPAAWWGVAATLAATAWSSERLYEGHLKLEEERINSLTHYGELEPVSRFVAVTDRGQEVELFRWANYLLIGADDVPTAAAIEPSNCHGWVFAKDEYFLREGSVEQILKDNGYEPCEAPKSGDLIVYRDQEGTISHTGVVQMAFLGRVPVIESKWGMDERFMHPPEVQPYGNRYSYYRSPRQGHALMIRDAKPD